MSEKLYDKPLSTLTILNFLSILGEILDDEMVLNFARLFGAIIALFPLFFICGAISSIIPAVIFTALSIFDPCPLYNSLAIISSCLSLFFSGFFLAMASIVGEEYNNLIKISKEREIN